MSIIKLGNLVTNVTYNEDYDYYVASIIDSQSGFMTPKLVRTVSQLRSYFGSFKYESMYSELLKNEIPVLLLPKLTGVSDSNRCTLRISEIKDGEKSTYKYSHPQYGKEYKSDSTIETSDLEESTYNCIIDFSQVDLNQLLTDASNDSDEIEIPYIIVSRDGESYSDNNTDKDNRSLIQISKNIRGSAVYTEMFTDEPIRLFEGLSGSRIQELPLFDPDDSMFDPDNPDDHYDPNRVISLFHALRWAMKDKLGIDSVNILDEIKDALSEVLTPDKLTEIIQLNTDPDIDTDQDLSNLRDADFKLLVDEVINSIYLYGFLTSNPRSVSYVVSDAFEIIKSWLYSVDTIYCDLINELMNAIKEDHSGTHLYDSLNINCIALKYSKKVIVPYYTNIVGLDVSSNSDYDQDIESIRTEDSKLIEFYSKIKGPQGSDTHISISEGDIEDTYYITITNGDEVESYNVTTVPRMTESLYYDQNSRYDYITVINQRSNLVFIKFFDFIEDGKYVCQSDLDIDEVNKLSEVELYTAFGYTNTEPDYSGDWIPNPRKLVITEDDLYLDRYVDEYPTYEDEFDTLEVLNESEWYPDLVLVNELNFGNRPYSNSDYVHKLNDYCMSHKTQALIKVDKYNFVEKSNYLFNSSLLDQVLPSIPGSRLLTFYGELTINDYVFPSFYPYILNILNSDFLNIPTEKILYNQLPEKLDQVIINYDNSVITYNYEVNELKSIDIDLLKSLNVNYFDYNNIYYNYKRLREPNPDPDFQVIYCTSKISRIFLNASDYLIGSEPESFELRITELIRRAKALLPLVDNIDYKYEFDGNRYDIELSVILTKLVNKIFIFNITLNI